MKMFSLQIRKRKALLLTLLIIFTALILSKTFLSCHFPDANTSFEAFTDALFLQEISSDTISLHYTLINPSDYGITSYPVSFGEISADPELSKSSIETCLQALERFDGADLSQKNQLTYEILHHYLTSSMKGTDYLFYQEPLSPVIGIHAQLPILLSEYKFYNKEDIDVYLALLCEIDTYFSSIIHFETQKLEQGLFMPDYQIQEVISYCKSFIAMDQENYLISSFVERINCIENLTSQEKNDFIKQNNTLIDQEVFPAYQSLIFFLESYIGSGKNQEGLCHFPKGKTYYEYLVQQEAGVSESIPELQQLILTQLYEDLGHIQKTLLEESFSHNTLSTTSPEGILEHLKAKSQNLFPKIETNNAEIKYVSSAMEEYLSPAFYMIPAIDNLDENIIYINQGQTMDGIHLYTTLAHEGCPGHMYQTVYFASQKPDAIRHLLNFGGYVEGWATYAEMVSYYFSGLPKADASILQKSASLTLGLYAYADLAIHYEGWTFEKMEKYFNSFGYTDKQTLREIYELIVGTPGNYAKYYLGYLKIYLLKKELSAALGKKFSHLEFHKAILDVGPAPFDIVEKYVKDVLL